MDLFEAMRTCRSIRRFRPDPIPEADLRRILEAAICAPSGGNRQNWAFVVVRDPELRRRIGEYYREATLQLYASGYLDPPEGASDEVVEQYARRRRNGERFAHHIHEAPVIVIACLRTADGEPPPFTAGGSIYPAVQNLMLAARALGIGSVITTNHKRTHDREVNELLGIPPDYVTAALVPLGYPAGRFGPLSRRPIEEVCFADRFSQPIELPPAPETTGE